MAVLVGGAVAVALLCGSLVGGVLAEPSSSRAPASGQVLADPALTATGGGSGGSTARAVTRLEVAVRSRPDDVSALTQLGFGYQLRWRETSDPSFLPRSEAALMRAIRSQPDAPDAILGLGALALIRHEFRAALEYGRRARLLLPGSARPYGVIGDALVELGRYDAAFAAFQRMVTLRPNLASYARVAYARELTGDLSGALAAMELALDSAGGQPEPAAFALVEIAKLERLQGRVREARQHAAAALRGLPGYPAARLVLAGLDARAGRIEQALARTRRVADAVPTPESYALLAELLDRSGRRAEALTARRTVAAMDRLLEASGVRVDLESAVYRADIGLRPGATVELARRAREARPSIYGDDALGWALVRAGRCRAGLTLLERSLRLGTKDPLLFFHRGYAEGCVGNAAAMRDWYTRALELDPGFSLRWAPVARAAFAR